MRKPLQVAEHEHVAVSRLKTSNLLIQQVRKFNGRMIGSIAIGRLVVEGRFAYALPAGICPAAPSDSRGDFVQPGAEALPISELRRPTQENQECGLECVVDPILIAEPTPANTEYERPVQPNNRLNGHRIAP